MKLVEAHCGWTLVSNLGSDLTWVHVYAVLFPTGRTVNNLSIVNELPFSLCKKKDKDT